MYWFRGEIALMMVPSDRQAMPSHWKPGRSPLKPRSTRISTEVPAEVPQASGTSPRSRSHLVLQGRPQAAPCSWGVNSLPQGLEHRHGFVRRVPAAQCQRHAARVDGRADPVTQKAVQPDFRKTAVVVQCDPLQRWGVRSIPIDG